MNILITGAVGFSGKKLAKILSKDPANELFLCDRIPSRRKSWIVCDLAIPQHVEALIDQIRPQEIYHLAGTFSNDFNLDFESNVLTTKNIFDALLRYQHRCRVLLVGSAAEYGMVAPEDNPISEQHPLNPISIYGLTKVYQTNLMKYYCVNHSLDIVMARTFNLLGRGQSERLFMGQIYKQVDLFKSGKINKIVLGNLNSKRDYIAINKTILHYIDIMKFGTSGEIYNVGSGHPIKMHSLLIRILNRNGINIDSVEINQENIIGNKSEVQIIYADISKIKQLRR